jgi:hypothetical protein
MRHRKNEDFDQALSELPKHVRDLAQKSFEMLKANPKHPALHFKPVGPYWSAHGGRHYRAVADARDYGFLWFWIATHADYDKLIV